MEWITLNSEAQLNSINEVSHQKPQVILKHSISCPVSAMAKYRLEQSKTPVNADFYYLDLINNRPVSNAVAAQYGVAHQSPQVIMVKDGKSIYDASHHRVNMDAIAAAAGS